MHFKPVTQMLCIYIENRIQFQVQIISMFFFSSPIYLPTPIFQSHDGRRESKKGQALTLHAADPNMVS